MGTYVSIKVAVADRHERRLALAAVADVRDRIVAFGHDGWAWGDGALARINLALARGEAAPIPAGLRELFALAWQFHQDTRGLFNPMLGSAVRQWGFDDPARTRAEPPCASELAEILASVRTAPAYDGGESYGPAPGITWDFGGIGKGYIIDLSLRQLAAAGIRHAVIDAGGNIAVRGRCGPRSWHIGIRDPRPSADETRVLASLDVGDEAVITHGTDQRFFDHHGRRYSHILHGRSGRPVEGVRSLTVVHPSAVVAEAVGLALFCADAGERGALARQLGITRFLMILEDGRMLASVALASRLRLPPDITPELFEP